MADDLSLIVNGSQYGGWQDVGVKRSIEQLAGMFSVAFSERWNEDNSPLPINEGDEAQVLIDDDDVLTGYVDDSDIGYGNGTHTASVAGRSKTEDLVDCAAVRDGGTWRDAGIATIAADICAPFGIDVVASGDMGAAFPRFALQDGETAFEALSRAADARGLMLLTKPDGSLLLSRAGTREVATVLQRGVNIKAGGRRGSMRNRYSQYTVKVQLPGNDKRRGRKMNIARTVTDDRVTRYRPTILMGDSEDTGAEVEERAKWEMNRRAGEARRLSYTVKGWRDDSGDLWEPNTLINVIDDWLRVDAQLLLVSASYRRNNEGTTTGLELARPEAFDIIGFPSPRGATQGQDFFA